MDDCLRTGEALAAAGHEVIGPAASSGEALQLAKVSGAELAFIDIDLETRGIGLQLARELHSAHNIAVVLTTGQPELARSCTCALGLFAKPYDPHAIAVAVTAIASILGGTTPTANSIPRAFELFASRGPVEGAETPTARLQPVLLVEDHPYDVELALAALEKCGVANPIAVARDGVEAIEYLHGRNAEGLSELDRPVLVLLDIKMPRLNGLEVLDHIKKHPTLHVIPVVMLSASCQEADTLYCQLHGAEDFIVKPSGFHEYREALKGLNRFWTPH